MVEEFCPILTISNILQKADKDMVSLEGYISVENRPVVSVKLRRGDEKMNKKEVAVNDHTGVIKLTLWDSLIDSVLQSCTYMIESAKIREWPTGVLSITTTPSSKIKPSSKKIQPTKGNLKELTSIKIRSPPESVKSITSHKCCPNCYSKSEANSTIKLFKCPNCATMVLAHKLQQNYTIKVVMGSDRKLVTIFHEQNAKYFKENIPDSEEDIIIELLSDETTELVINGSNTCIDMITKT